MAPFLATVLLDVKCLNLNASQDAGTTTKGRPTGTVECWSSHYLQVSFSVNDITTYGGGAFKTGICAGFVRISIPGMEYWFFPAQFDEVKASGKAFYRFYGNGEWFPYTTPF